MYKVPQFRREEQGFMHMTERRDRSVWKLFSASYDLFLLLFFLAPEIGADVIPLLVA